MSKTPYTQGFNKDTKEIILVFTVDDIQNALADHETGKTISEADALEFMKARDSKIVDALLYQWSETLSDLATALEFKPAKETELP